MQIKLQETYKADASSRAGSAQEVKERGPLQPIVDMVPSNFFQSASNNRNMLQVVFIALLIGIGLIQIPKKKAKPVLDVFEGLNDVIIKLVDIIMLMAPIGVFALIAQTINKVAGEDPGQVAELLGALGYYMIAVIIGLGIHMAITYAAILRSYSKMPLKTFYTGIGPAQLLAFSTSSSGATLPVTMERCEDELGVSEEISSFVLPLGATINMDGTAIMQGCATYFLAAYYGIDLVFSDFVLIILTATVASIGTAGIPSAGIIMLSLILTELGIPLEGITLLLGVDRLLDMMRTSVNVSGDTCISCVVAQSEKLIDIKKYNQ